MVTPSILQGSPLSAPEPSPAAAISYNERKPDSSQASGFNKESTLPEEQRRLLELRRHISLRLVLVCVTALFTLGPAIGLWLSSWESWDAGIRQYHHQMTQSIEELNNERCRSLIGSGAALWRGLLLRLDQGLSMYVGQFQMNGLLDMKDGSILNNGLVLSKLGNYSLHLARGFKRLSVAETVIKYVGNASCPAIIQSFAVARFPVNVLTGQPGESFLLITMNRTASLPSSSPSFPSAFSTVNLAVLDKATGWAQPFAKPFLMNTSASINRLDDYNVNRPASCEFSSDVVFMFPTGLPHFYARCTFPFIDGVAAIQGVYYVPLYTVPVLLRAFLVTAKDRSFLSFCDVRGTLIGTSHGKYYSHSDQDPSKINAMQNISILTQLRSYSAMEATDPTIHQASAWINAAFHQDWSNIPELATTQTVNGEPFWIISSHITYKYGLRLQLFFVADRTSRMAAVEAIIRSSIDTVTSDHQKLIIVICVLVVVFALLSIVFSAWLASFYQHLAQGLHRLLTLEFAKHQSRDDPTASSHSIFTEIHACEATFLAMERGLRAFSRYVPEPVVRMVLTEDIQLNLAQLHLITVLSADIAGFSTLSETVTTEVLLKYLNEYLQKMCKVIHAQRGMLDKYIGDCIIAFWNAPKPMAEHESAACFAAFKMQSKLIEFCEQRCGGTVPEIRFRAGISTDSVLIGNFGCKYHIAYTCVGPGAYRASRLEATNKMFGTVVLVNQDTKDGAADKFHFRKIAKTALCHNDLSVPIYELLFPIILPTEMSTPAGCVQRFPLVGARRASESAEEQTTVALIAVTPSEISQGHIAANCQQADSAEGVLFHWERKDPQVVLEVARHYEKGLEYFFCDDFGPARDWFMKALTVIQGESASRSMLNRCNRAPKPGVPTRRITRNQTFWEGGVLRLHHEEEE